MNYDLVQNNAGHYTLSGVIAVDIAQALEQEGLRYLEQEKRCHFVLENLTYFDSALIAVLLAYQRFAVKHKKSFVLEIRSHKLVALMQVYNVYDLFTHFY